MAAAAASAAPAMDETPATLCKEFLCDLTGEDDPRLAREVTRAPPFSILPRAHRRDQGSPALVLAPVASLTRPLLQIVARKMGLVGIDREYMCASPWRCLEGARARAVRRVRRCCA